MLEREEAAAALIRQEAEGGALLTDALLKCMANGDPHLSCNPRIFGVDTFSTDEEVACTDACVVCGSYRRTSISGTTLSGKKCLSGTSSHAI
jgi:hypothetical protein